MKCKICGCEVGPTQTHCPMCGARVSADDEVIRATRELSWNTKDFPKPKEMEDINMSWPEFNTRTNTVSLSEAEISAALEKNRPVTVMSEDASEGYVSIPDKKDEKPAAKPAPAKEESKADESTRPYWYTQKFTATGVMQTGPAWPMAPGDTKPSYPATAKIESMTLSEPMPITPVQPDPASMEFTLRDIIPERAPRQQDTQPKFYTFQRKNDEFQKLLDREYDRIHAMHGDDFDPLRDTLHPFQSEPTVHAQELTEFEKLLMEDVPAQTEETPAQKFFSQSPEIPRVEETVDPEPPAEVELPAGDPTKYDIEAIENTIKELESQEVIAENNRSLRKKRLAAMAAAREAYFRSLDEVAGGKDPDLAAREVAEAVEAAKKDPVTPVSDATFINLDAPESSEPTREIPVGGILEALAGIGTVRSAAMAVKEAPMITADPASTRVFRRISEDAEDRAKLYEQPEESEAPAAEEAEAPVMQEPSEEPLPEKSIDDLLAELRSEAAKAAESIPEEKTAEEQPTEEISGPAQEEQPAEDAAQVIEETPQRAHVAGAADAELLATKYDLEEELSGLEETPAEEELPAEAVHAEESPAEEPEANEEHPIEEQPAEEEKPLDVTQQFDPNAAEGAGKEDQDSDEEDDEEEEVPSKHIFLKIVIAILIVCAVFELAVFGFSKLAPDAGATQALIQIEEAIRAALASAFEAVKGLFGGR